MPLKNLSKGSLFLLISNMIVTKHLENIVFQGASIYLVIERWNEFSCLIFELNELTKLETSS